MISIKDNGELALIVDDDYSQEPSAAQVSDIGQRMLQRQIEARLDAGQRGEITWKKVSIVLAIIATIAIGALLLRD